MAEVWLVKRAAKHPNPLLSSPAKAGDPVRRSFSIQALPSLEYWVTRLRG
jgi:hypothetical protein